MHYDHAHAPHMNHPLAGEFAMHDDWNEPHKPLSLRAEGRAPEVRWQSVLAIDC